MPATLKVSLVASLTVLIAVGQGVEQVGSAREFRELLQEFRAVSAGVRNAKTDLQRKDSAGW